MRTIKVTSEAKTKTPQEIEKIRASGVITSGVLRLLAETIQAAKSGELTPLDLDRVADDFIVDHGGVSAFRDYNGFPNCICVSVNDAVIHGIPRSTPLVDGDIVSVDVGVKLDGWFTDACVTVPVGDWHKLDPEALNLLRTTYAAMQNGIAVAAVGVRTGLISATLQATVEAGGCEVVPGYDGHGIGRNLHEGPEVPPWGRPQQGVPLPSGIVICIEPIATTGEPKAWLDEDDWTVVTGDGAPAAHYEKTVAVTEDGTDVLTPYDLKWLPWLKGVEQPPPRSAAAERASE